MNHVSSKKIKECAEKRWECGYYGDADLHVEFHRRLTIAESDRIRGIFRPLVYDELEKMRRMPKRELNRDYHYWHVSKSIKLDGENRESFFEISRFAYTRFVNGRRIVDPMTMDEVLGKNIYSTWRPHNGDWHDTESYVSLERTADGSFVRHIRETIHQNQFRNARGGFNRSKSKAAFVKLVKEYVAKQNEDGWTLEAVEDPNGRCCLIFGKPDPAEVEPVVQHEAPAVPATEPAGGQTFSEINPEQKDIDRIQKILESYEDNPQKAVEAARLMNSKIKDEAKRARRAKACVDLGAEWLAHCFAA